MLLKDFPTYKCCNVKYSVLLLRILIFLSNIQAEASFNYSGTRHEKNLKAVDSSDSKIKTSELVVKETTSQIFSSSCLQPSGSDTTSEGLSLKAGMLLCAHVSVCMGISYMTALDI